MPLAPGIKITINTNGSGNATETVRVVRSGKIDAIRWDAGFASCPVTITNLRTGEVIDAETLAAAKFIRPSAPVHDQAGAATGDADSIRVAAGDEIEFDVVGGTASGTGVFVLDIEVEEGFGG